MRSYIFAIIIIIAIPFFFIMSNGTSVTDNNHDILQQQKIKFDNAELNITVADTSELRAKGLSGSLSLEKDTGMLFIFGKDDSYGIWMKDMNFAIDIVWLDSNLRVVDIKRDARPDSYPEVFTPSKPARYVLEINSGLSAELNIKIGDKANL